MPRTAAQNQLAAVCRWPRGFFGFSSGWHPEGLRGERHPITYREPVALRPIPADFTPLAPGGRSPIPMLVKVSSTSDGELRAGLSCGAASALIEGADAVYKLKRCGFRTEGFRRGKRNRYHETIGTDIVEDLVLVERPFGLLPTEGASNEIGIVKRVRDAGLCEAYSPVGTFSFHVPGADSESDIAAAALCSITSDLRADELFFAIVVTALKTAAHRGEFVYVPDQRRFALHGLQLSSILADIRDGAAHRSLQALGRALGGALRLLHRIGFIRGYNNSWFGNDVIGPDGRISLVDHDNSVVVPEAPLSEPLRGQLRALNCYGYTAQLWQEATRFSVLPISAAAMEVASGFEQGYNHGHEPTIGVERLHQLVSEYLEHRDLVMGHALP